MTARPGVGRRALLAGGLTTGAAGLVTGCTHASSGEQARPAPSRAGAPAGAPAPATETVPFRGPRQAGVVTPPQPYAAFVALDLAAASDRDTLRRLLTVWTDDIERLMAGRGPLTDVEPELAAVPSGLTVTVGLGRGAVEAAGVQPPAWLAPLPPFRIDRLEKRWSGGDLVLQVCSYSPTTVSHAVRRLTTAGAPMAAVRWVQRGFREPAERDGVTMRNLLGQVDGTVQPRTDGPHDALIWSSGPEWLSGGSGLVIRRIAMNLDTWDKVDRTARENAIGRRLDTGQMVADIDAVDSLGFHVVDDASHVRRARPAQPHERILRRPYSYDDGVSGAGATNGAGLIFAAYSADPMRQFVPIQQRLAAKDLLNIWTTPIGSAVFAVLPGAQPGEILGERLLAAQ